MAYISQAPGSGGGGSAVWGSIGGSIGDQTDLQAEFANYAPLASPALTGTPTAPTPTSTDNTTKLATTAFVKTAISGLSVGYPVAANFAALPGAGTVPSGTTYLCLAGQGVYFVNRKPAGLYTSDGVSVWSYEGDLADAYFNDANTEFFDNADNTKLGKLDLSGLGTGVTSTQKWPVASGQLVSWVAAPAAANSAGTAGQAAYDASYIYLCVATNTWIRTPLGSW